MVESEIRCIITLGPTYPNGLAAAVNSQQYCAESWACFDHCSDYDTAERKSAIIQLTLPLDTRTGDCIRQW